MKKMNVLLVVLILLCLGVFFGYRTLDSLRTDDEAPTIHMGDQIPEISVEDPKSVLLQGVTARDNRDGDVTDSLVVESVELLSSDGQLQISYAAFDKAGNVAKSRREAKYVDYRSPRFSLEAPLLYRLGTNFDVLSTVGATDVIDGEIQHRIRATSLVDRSIAELGTHDVQFQVNNSLGDTTTEVFPVEVYDPEMYDAGLALTQYLVYLEPGDSFESKSYLKTFTLGGEDTDLRKGLSRDYSLKTTGGVQTQTPGVYPVEYRVTYTEKHETDPELDRQFTGYSKLIVIVEG